MGTATPRVDAKDVEVAPGVYRFGSRLVNWYAIEDGGSVTLVDTGFPRHWRQVEPGLRSIGSGLDAVSAVLITHSHVDHTGFAWRLAQRNLPVFVHRADAVHGARRFPPLHLYARPTSWPLLAEGLRDGMPFTRRIPEPAVVGHGEILEIPGRPRAVHLSGHTPGSTAFVLEDRGVVFTGDNLVTMDPYTRRSGPQLMLCGVQHDEDQALRALDDLARLDVPTVLPGHGGPWAGGVAAACAQARDRHAALHARFPVGQAAASPGRHGSGRGGERP
jgi:glyoxylase-like metal-dependent hydrolase (beta-lactamase superfamily II)